MLVEGQNRITPYNNISTTEQGSTVSIKQYMPNLSMHSPEVKSQSPTLSTLQKGPKRKYFEQWVYDVSDQTSLHGLIWYTRVQNIWIRLIIVLAVITIVFGMPAFITFKLYFWSFDQSLITTIEPISDPYVKYPVITFCNPGLFKKSSLETYDISNELANYISWSLEFNVKSIYDYMSTHTSGFKQRTEELKDELDQLLIDHNLTILELYKRLAIHCNETVNFCEIHRRFYDPTIGDGRHCCEVLFDTNPIFTHKGTCYKTNRTIFEHFPLAFSNIRIWTNLLVNRTPEFELGFRGSDAVLSNGIFFAVSNDLDHPAATLMEYHYATKASSSYNIGISISEVSFPILYFCTSIIGRFWQVDRTALDTCQKDINVDEFVRNYGVNYSKLNCQVFKDLDNHGQCSINSYFGIHMKPSKPACLPKDLLDQKYVINDGFMNGNLSRPINSTCKYECFSRHYILKVNQGGLDLKSLKKLVATYQELDPDYTAITPEKIKAEDFIVFNFYFESFDFTRIVLSQETFTDILCK